MVPLASSVPSAHPTLRHTARGLGLTGSWGLTQTLGGSPRGPSKGAWRPNAGDWEPPKPSAGLTLQPPATHPGRFRCRRLFRAGEQVGPSEPPASFEGPLCQNTWAHAPALQRTPLGPPPCSPQRRWILPAGLLGANPNPSSAPKGPLPRGLALQDWGLGPPSPSAVLTLRPTATQAVIGAADHSEWENVQPGQASTAGPR